MSFGSSIIIRYALVLLYGWFSFHQLFDPMPWVAYLPEWTGYMPIPGEMLVRLNGWFELIFAVMLLMGFYTRFAAALLGLHLLGIAFSVGGAVGMRDTTLALCTLALVFSPADQWTLDAKWKKPVEVI